ncbi:MAG: PIN domain-containing protein [Actinobacteria bacterium]|nr:PIN domain-containing protein [Actinomycetota bacterium]
MTRLAVIDTDVVVSGLLSGDADSPTRRIIDAMLEGTVAFVLSESLLAEYRVVLLRPAIKQRHGLTEVELDIVLEELVLNAGFREPEPLGRADPPAGRPNAPWAAETAEPGPSGDEHVIALLAVVPEAILVTGDRRPAEAVVSWRVVGTPAEFAAGLVDKPG